MKTLGAQAAPASRTAAQQDDSAGAPAATTDQDRGAESSGGDSGSLSARVTRSRPSRFAR